MWFCATAVVVAVLLTRALLDSPVSAAVVAAALGVGTAVPYLMAQAGRAQHLYLVDSASASIAAAAVVGVAIGVVGSLVVSRLAAAARVPASGAVAGAALVCLFVRREPTATLVVAGLLTVSTVAAAILAAAVVGPTPSGDHRDGGLSVLGPLLLGGLLAYGLLTVVARYRGRSRQTEASVAAGSPERAGGSPRLRAGSSAGSPGSSGCRSRSAAGCRRRWTGPWRPGTCRSQD